MSTAMRAREAAEWMGGELLRGSPEQRFEGTSIDTRTLTGGELFVAIAGEQFDAHGFLDRALAGGAAGLAIERGRAVPESAKPDLPVIAVDDTTRALGALAAGHRAGFDGPLVAITGSNGKTTTKEMCAAILSVDAACLSNRGNLNNQFGLPLTLLRRGPEHRRVVVELGMNHRGEIAALAAIARPTVGVITNVGTAHIENLGSREEIALEKGDLVAALPSDGVAVLNADDHRVEAQAARTAARVVRFGSAAGADVRAEDVRERDGGGFAFTLTAPQGRVAVELDALGEVALANALAASAAALAAGASLEAVSRGLGSVGAVRGRLERRDLPGGAVVVDDTYNANPQSLAAALHTLVERRGDGRATAVLGAMGELDDPEAAHREGGRLAAELGVDRVVALGDAAAGYAEGAIASGMDAGCAGVVADPEEAAARVADDLRAGDWVLVKGSRAARMERVVEALERRLVESAGGSR